MTLKNLLMTINSGVSVRLFNNGKDLYLGKVSDIQKKEVEPHLDAEIICINYQSNPSAITIAF